MEAKGYLGEMKKWSTYVNMRKYSRVKTNSLTRWLIKQMKLQNLQIYKSQLMH